MGKTYGILNSKKTENMLLEIYPESEANRRSRRLYREKVLALIMVMTVTIILFLIMMIKEHKSASTPVNQIKREDIGKGDTEIGLVAEIEGTGKGEKINLHVEDRKYSEEELDIYLEEFETEIWNQILGDNSSLEDVSKDLKLPNKLEGFPFDITWKSEKPLIISSDGIIDKTKLKEELDKKNVCEIPVRLCASYSYEDYKGDVYGYVVIKPNTVRNYESFVEELYEALELADKDSKSSDYLILPTNISGIRVDYHRSKNKNCYLILILGAVTGTLIVIGKDKDIEKQLMQRRKQLEEDYVKILDQYTLYYLAGMNHRRIWDEICKRYVKEQMKGKEKRSGYEEMLIANKRMKEGVLEISAYEEFASRCNNTQYRAFINLVTQSVKLGNSRFYENILEEVEKSRKASLNMTRMKIQEMSTKLLFPMILMLIVVLIVVMIPAFVSFSN